MSETVNNTWVIDKSEKRFSNFLSFFAYGIVALLLGIFITLLIQAWPSIKVFGLSFFGGRLWNPVTSQFGALPFLVGTLATSFLALLISIPFSIAISVLLGEYYKEGALSSFLKSSIEVLAGIPSVIYGLWGLFILIPIVRAIEIRMGVPSEGVGLFSSSLILAIMVIPYAASIGREVIALAPADLKEAAFSLGATRYEVVKKIVLPYARSGIIAGILLSLGRALGETMAVTMLIGNRNTIPYSIFAPANTMASVIANEFTEATLEIYVSSLINIALVLFLVTMVVNLIGNYIIKKVSIAAEREVT
ncbi:MAG: phosphate ABC transporter permease subunit PstC [Pseudomonadota bacterium]